MSSSPVVAAQTERTGSIDINAAPLGDSGDEEPPQSRSSTTSSNSATQFESFNQMSTKSGVAKPASHPDTRKRTRGQIEDTEPRIRPPLAPLAEATPSSFDAFDMIGDGSQNKRKKTYSSSQNKGYGSQRPVFKHPKAIKDNRGQVETADFVMAPDLPQKTCEESSPLKLRVVPDPLRILENSKAARPIFTLPNFDLREGLSSASTTKSDTNQVFDETLNPRKRSESTSSLSSLNSDGSVALTCAAKSTLTSTNPTHTASCPFCLAPVSPAHLEEFSNGRRLNIRQQQRFCQSHKKLDAAATFSSSGYPTISWSDLTTIRIPKQIRHLSKVLSRKVPCYYRRKLEEAAATANSRRGLQTYLKEGSQDVITPGYYGPKGARIMTQEITARMAEQLNAALKKDKIVRAVEVGGFVSCVLVPELTLRLVMDDRGWGEGKLDAALQVLDESTEVGMLVNGDDDERVVLREQEEG